jgi:copper(I)-binding protein
MTRIRALAIAALVATGFSGFSARAGDCLPQVRDGWVRLPAVAMPMMAGFSRIENRCAAPLVIVGVSSPAFSDTSLHETRIVDGVSRMRALPEVRIAPHGVAALKPGGMHLMLMAPRAPLKPGSRVVVEFALQGGGTLRGEFVVRKPGE